VFTVLRKPPNSRGRDFYQSRPPSCTIRPSAWKVSSQRSVYDTTHKIVFGKARRATPRLCENRATATTCGGVHKDLSYRTMRWPVADSLALCLRDES
jgi:hypothetical protein